MELNPDELRSDAQKPTTDTVTLTEVTKMAEQLLIMRDRCEAAEVELETLKKEYDEIAQKKLPELIRAAGLTAVPLIGGTVIEVEEQVGCGIKADQREAAHSWLRENGLGDLIKNEVTVTFGKGEDKDAALLIHNIKVMADNDALHFGAINQEERVHPSTLKSFVKDRLKSGEPLPLDTFNVFVGQIARIKTPKRKT